MPERPAKREQLPEALRAELEEFQPANRHHSGIPLPMGDVHIEDVVSAYFGEIARNSDGASVPGGTMRGPRSKCLG